MTITDTQHRPLRDLRISVTDRCNFRCPYCMPKEVYGSDWVFLPHGELLSFDEISQLAHIFVDLGVQKIRITGGEPLLRRGLERLIEMLAAIGGTCDLTLTTNGLLLASKARSLKDAGLQRVTVSLDALDDEVFRAMNDVSVPVMRVLEGIDAAADCGLAPVKINMVVRRGTNEHCVHELAHHFRHTGHILRFIEYMDVGHTNGWRMEDVVTAAEILAMMESEWSVEQVPANYRGEVSQAVPLSGWGRGIWHHRFGHTSFLRRLYPHAAHGRWAALHLPVCNPGPRSAQAAAKRSLRR